MNWRERVIVSIPCYGIRFSAVLYITNTPSIQMIQQLLGSPVIYQFYEFVLYVFVVFVLYCTHKFFLFENISTKICNKSFNFGAYK